MSLPGGVGDDELLRLVAQAQAGDNATVEALLHQFRPLLRARMHSLWATLRDDLTSIEWADVEAQVQVLFLSRLQTFEPQQGVFFPHYIARMLDLDSRQWLRQQRRQQAVPFSQLYFASESSDELEWWLRDEETTRDCDAVEQVVSMQDALKILSPSQRDVVWQCCVVGRTENAVAEELQISRSAVRNRLQSALEHLRAFFGEHGAVTELPAVGHAKTRTGRRVPRAVWTQYELWLWRFEMSRDEKRPDLVGVGAGQPILLQGVYDFPATGLKTPQLLSPKLRYVVPSGYVAGIRFCRIGVSCEKMVYLATVVNGMPHRLVPVAANSTAHVPFAIVEPIVAGSEIEIHIASDAPGTAIIDVGCLQMPA